MSELFRIDTGRGRPVVLLHGGFLDHRMWGDQIPVFAQRYRVIAPDARGHGRSPNATAPFRPVDDLADLLRGLDAGPAALVGVSMGAGTATDLALEYPELVSALIVTGAGTSEPAFSDPWTTALLARWNAALAAGDADRWLEAFLSFAAGPHRDLGAVAGDVVPRLRTMALNTIGKHTADEPNHLVPVADTWERAAAIEVPVLAINGSIDSDDHIGMADRLAATVRDGRTATIEGAAHYPNMERPDAYNTVLLEFLGRDD